jgi:mannose-1-phosphate guanylyltransferase
MQIVLLSGGSGKRLWPLSNDVRSKQFLKILRDKDGNRQSMVQRVYAQIKQAQPRADITIATNAAQVDNIRSQLGSGVDVVVEPERRDTFPAVALTCAHLALAKQVELEETVIILPVDVFTELGFFTALTQVDKLVRNNAADIVLVGIGALLPTAKYGYIVPQQEISAGVYAVARFVEKPDEQRAAGLIAEGAYWNGGVFAFKLSYLMELIQAQTQFTGFEELHSKYGELERISFDYKVVEKAERVAVVPYHGKWADIGTWRTLTDEMPVSSLGVVLEESTRNTFVVNELNIPIVALGTRDLIIAANPDGILVSELKESSRLKPVVDRLEHTRPMYEDRHWGDYTVLTQDDGYLVKRLFLAKGKALSYQSHKFRDEVWVVTDGSGKFLLNDEVSLLTVGDTVKIMRGQKHSIEAVTDLLITEIQLGDILDENDIERFPFDVEDIV